MGPITQQEIAQALGISLKTVQRAFNQPGSVSPIQRDRIMEFALKNGYTPNRSARALQGRNRRRIAILTMDTPRSFWADVASGAEVAAHQIAHLGFDVVYKRAGSYEAMMRHLRAIARDGVDCIALVNHTGMEMERIVSWVKRHEIPFAALNADFLDADRICYLGPEHRQQGELAGEVIGNLLREGGTVALFTIQFDEGSFMPGADILRQRRDGAVSVLSRLPGVEIHEVVVRKDGEVPNTRTIIDQLRSVPAEKGVIFWIPPFTDYFVELLNSSDPSEMPDVVGFDLSPEITGFLQSGRVTAEIYQNPTLQGYGIVKLMETYVESGQRPPRDRYIITPQVIFRSNVDQRNNFDIIGEISKPLIAPQI